jgi:hypothetical protein
MKANLFDLMDAKASMMDMVAQEALITAVEVAPTLLHGTFDVTMLQPIKKS